MAYRASTVTRTAQGSGTSIVVTYPTVAANDILLAWVVQDASTTQTHTDPAGWTSLGNADITGPDQQKASLWWKLATGSESGTFTVTSSVGGRAIAICASWSGRNTAAPITFSQSTGNTTANASPITVALAGGTAASGDDIAWMAQLDQAAATDTWNFTPPSGFTERQDDANGDWITTTLATQDGVSAGATGTISGTGTQVTGSTGAGWSGFVVALAAAAVFPTNDDSWNFFSGDDAAVAESETWIEELASDTLRPNSPLAAIALPDVDFDWSDVEDQVLLDAEWSGPIQPNAPPSTLPLEDAWPWDDSADEAENDSTSDKPVVANNPLRPSVIEDAWNWEESPDEVEADFGADAIVGSNSASLPSVIEDAWPWDDTPEEYESPEAEAPVGANGAAPAPISAQDDFFFEEDSDEDFYDDFGNVEADPPIRDDAWEWDLEQAQDDDWTTVSDTGPIPTASANQSIAVPVASITLAAQAPTVAVSGNQSIAVPVASLTLDAFAPTVSAGASNSIAVPLATISLNALAPSVAVSNNQAVAVPLATVSLNAQTPTVTATANNFIAVPGASVTLAAQTPSVSLTNNQSVAVPTASLTLDAFAPLVDTGGPKVIAVPTASLTLDAYAPEVVTRSTATGGFVHRLHDFSKRRLTDEEIRQQRIALGIEHPDPEPEKVAKAAALLVEQIPDASVLELGSAEQVADALREQLQMILGAWNAAHESALKAKVDAMRRDEDAAAKIIMDVISQYYL